MSTDSSEMSKRVQTSIVRTIVLYPMHDFDDNFDFQKKNCFRVVQDHQSDLTIDFLPLLGFERQKTPNRDCDRYRIRLEFGFL